MEDLKNKLNEVGQERDCQVIDNARYKRALKIAAREIASLRYLLHDDDLDQKYIREIEHSLLLQAKKEIG